MNPKNNVFFDPPRTQFFEKHNIFMPAAGPSMKNNVFMGAGQLGLENNVSKVLTWTARVEKQCFFGIHRGPETRKTLFTSKKMSFYPEKDRELGNNCTLFARQGC